MATEPRYLLDTNILLRLSKRDDSLHHLVQSVVAFLIEHGADVCCTPQNIGEFWNVCTRPLDRNGYGLSISATDQALHWIEQTITVLPDNEHIYRIWRVFVVQYGVQGVKVHDAKLAAAIQVHGISHILTLDQPDFRRYTNISVVHPQSIAV